MSGVEFSDSCDVCPKGTFSEEVLLFFVTSSFPLMKNERKKREKR